MLPRGRSGNSRRSFARNNETIFPRHAERAVQFGLYICTDILMEERSMSRLTFILAIACLMAGCSSSPVKEQPRSEQPQAVAQPARPIAPPPKVEPKVSVKPVEQPRVVVDPLRDPTSPLAKRSIYYEFD